MKKTLSIGASLLLLVFIAGSCATSNDVASNKLIQKRKHLKGYHISTKQSPFKKSNKTQETEEFLVINDIKSEGTLKYDPALRHDNYQAVELDENIAINDTKVMDNQIHAIEAKSTKRSKAVSQETSSNEIALVNNNQTTSKKALKKIIKNKKNTSDSSENSADDLLILLVILCFLLPPIAVGIKTDWDITKLLISILLTIFFWLPGIIYALLVVLDVI
ncbi:YqaE/Pmp3 family membrane protein [Putridiphycobacter roseus]|nr:YqaE/Pmp3 family membrane protein [Putridiphycobacter roseus]